MVHVEVQEVHVAGEEWVTGKLIGDEVKSKQIM
jgi:hypothetical protein